MTEPTQNQIIRPILPNQTFHGNMRQQGIKLSKLQSSVLGTTTQHTSALQNMNHLISKTGAKNYLPFDNNGSKLSEYPNNQNRQQSVMNHNQRSVLAPQIIPGKGRNFESPFPAKNGHGLFASLQKTLQVDRARNSTVQSFIESANSANDKFRNTSFK